MLQPSEVICSHLHKNSVFPWILTRANLLSSILSLLEWPHLSFAPTEPAGYGGQMTTVALRLVALVCAAGLTACRKEITGEPEKPVKSELPVSAPTAAYAHTNRLAREKSPYLLQHQHNPVDWYAWVKRPSSRRDKKISRSLSASATRLAIGAMSWNANLSRARKWLNSSISIS